MSENLPLGQVLRTLRERGGLSRVAFAKLLGMPRANVSQMELGQRPVSLNTLMKVSRVTKVPAWKLVRRAELQNSNGPEMKTI